MYELLIIGGGAAGLFAAWEASEAGVKDIALLESLKNTGGNSAMAGGYLFSLETGQLRGSGMNDCDAELKEALYFHHYDMVEPGLLRRWFEETKSTIALLESWGYEFKVSELGEGYTHVMADSPGVSWFHRVLRPLTQKLEERGVTILRQTTAKAIERDPSGAVCAVEAETAAGERQRLEAGRVLLACGGFMARPELLKQYFPMYYSPESFFQIVPAPGNGIELAESAGALLNPECTLVKETGMCFTPGPNAPGRIFAMDGSVFISDRGRRFVDESLWNRNYAANAMLRQPDRRGYTIYSRETLESVMNATQPFDFRADREKFMAFLEKEAEKREECGFFDTLEELAAWIGADPAVLKKTIEDYNGYCETGVDKEFMKPKQYLLPLKSGPYLAIRIKPMYIDTIGPVVIDEEQHILDRDHRPIPGLYAAGVIAAGWEGRDYMRFGSALSFSVNSGRLVGKTIARELLNA